MTMEPGVKIEHPEVKNGHCVYLIFRHCHIAKIATTKKMASIYLKLYVLIYFGMILFVYPFWGGYFTGPIIILYPKRRQVLWQLL